MVPATQGLQRDAAAAEYLPAAQFPHAVVPATAVYLPASQSMHVEAVAPL